MKNLPLAGLRPLIALFLFIAFLGCRKDFDLPENQTSTTTHSSSTRPITIVEAKKWFEQSAKNRTFSSPVLPDDVYPLWFMAEESKFQGTLDIVIVPVSPKDSLVDIGSGNGLRLVVFKNAAAEIDGCFIFFKHDPSISPDELTTSNFRGVFMTVSLIGEPLTLAHIINGTIISGSNDPAVFSYEPEGPGDPGLFETLFGWLQRIKCPGYGGGGEFWGDFWGTISGWGSTIGGWFQTFGGWFGGSGSGSTGPIIIFPGGFGGPIDIGANTGTITPPIGSSSNTLSQFFNNAIFGNHTIFSQPTQYPCRNEWSPGLDEPTGQSSAMPALLTAHAEGIGNFASQWIQLMATGNYDSPEEALVDIDWDEVGNSNTNDMMDGSTLNTAMLQNVVTMLNQVKGQGCGYTLDEAWAALENGVAIQDLMELAEDLDLNITQINWLWNHSEIIQIVQSFLALHLNDPVSVDISSFVIQKKLEFITIDDLELLFDNPEIYEDYEEYLQQNPNTTEEVKETVLRMVMLAPSHPIENLSDRLICFNTNSNSNFTHKITLYVDQPVANNDASSSSKDKAGHTWITLEQDQGGGNVIKLSVGLYPENFATPCDQIDGGAYNDDGGHAFDVSVTWPISDYGFNLLINDLKSEPYAPVYNLSSSNCSTWAVEKVNQLGFNVPATNVVSLPSPPAPPSCHVEGLAPGQLGQDLRTYQLPAGATRNAIGGSSPASTCQ